MRVALLTREYPPEVYGGAGVHVEYLVPALARLVDVEVHCFGQPRDAGPVVGTYQPWAALARGAASDAVLGALSVDLAMAGALGRADLVHSHTWYTALGGHLARLLHDIPHVVTCHSLEPLRPWKAEQIGAGGYAVSRFCERTALESADAVIAVSAAMAGDILAAYDRVDPDRLAVVHNGIDTDEYRRSCDIGSLAGLGIDPDRPAVVFVGRTTRQKGVVHLLDAARYIDAGAQLVCCAGPPDDAVIGEEVRDRLERLVAEGRPAVWIEAMLERPDVVQVLSHASVFVCPSLYEPFGIVNLEAMACEAPVVATATGGIPEIVADGETGLLVPLALRSGGPAAPEDPDRFARELAAAVNQLLGDPGAARRLGQAGRRRVLERFAWPALARQTVEIYQRLVA